MTSEELQKQVLQLPIQERWRLVQAILLSLQEETRPKVKPRNLSRLRGIAKNEMTDGSDPQADYVDYLTRKYQ